MWNINIKVSIVSGLLLMSAVCFSGVFANAQTVNPGGPNQPCYAFNNNLYRGETGQDVFNLQTLLIREGLLHTSQPTLYFGPLTFAAVITFQEKYASTILTPLGLSRATGYVGSSTRAELNSIYGCGVSGNPVAGPGQHCGGNIANAPVCETGYYCAPISDSTIPLGDIGGICEPNPTNNQSPAISGISGPTTLNVGQTGTWSVTASDPGNGALSYSVVWGDQVLYPLPAANGSSNIIYNQTATFTHSYASAGIYTPVFYVRDANGNTATSSMSVNVGNSYTNEPAIQYLQPSSGAVGTSVTIVGSGFAPTGNRIVFGSLGIENNPSYNLNSSNNGTMITFTVPYSGYAACLNSIPACMIAEQLTQPGVYPVSVITSNGTSNQISFTVTSQTSCVPNWQCVWTPCNNGYQGMAAADLNNCGQTYQGPGIACPALARQCN